jgi:hypothetical protein
MKRGQAEHEAGEDQALEMMGAPGVGPNHLERAERPRARHGELDLAELGQQPAPVAAVASVGLAARGDALEMPVDDRGHARLEQLGQRLARCQAVVLAPRQIFRLHGLQRLKGHR